MDTGPEHTHDEGVDTTIQVRACAAITLREVAQNPEESEENEG